MEGNVGHFRDFQQLLSDGSAIDANEAQRRDVAFLSTGIGWMFTRKYDAWRLLFIQQYWKWNLETIVRWSFNCNLLHLLVFFIHGLDMFYKPPFGFCKCPYVGLIVHSIICFKSVLIIWFKYFFYICLMLCFAEVNVHLKVWCPTFNISRAILERKLEDYSQIIIQL